MSKKLKAKERRRREQQRLQAKREHQAAQEDALIKDLESEMDDSDELLAQDEDTEEGTPEEISKEYYGEMTVPMSGPTSWDELDAQHDAKEKAENVRKQTYAVEYLVGNILRDNELVPTEKADRMMDVADGFAERVNGIMGEEDMQKSVEVVEIEAILGTYERNRGILEKATDRWEDFLIKRELTGKARKRLADSDFALPDKRKYPIMDKAHVRNALARAAQQMEKGGEAAEDAKKAMPKIRAAAKKFGIVMSKSAFSIQKDKNSDWRWLGVASNNFLDWQNDIISKQAHRNYIEFLDQNPELAPRFMHWHMPGLVRKNKVDFWMEHDGALILSGKLTEDEARFLLKMQAKSDLGMSVGGLALSRDKQDERVVTNYALYEVSDLPLEKAANPFTSLETITKEAGMDKLEYLTDLMGSDEEAKAFLEKTAAKQKELAAAGLTSKGKDEEEVTEPVAEPETPAPIDADTLTAGIVEAVKKEFHVDELNAFVASAQTELEKIPLLEGLVKDLRKTRDEELVEELTPPLSRYAWANENRPSESNQTELKKESEEDEELKKANPHGIDPDTEWLSASTHTMPIKTKEVANA